LPRPTRFLNLSATKSSVTQTGSNIEVHPPGIPALYVDTGVTIPKYIRTTN
jgi:hypothetical protein